MRAAPRARAPTQSRTLLRVRTMTAGLWESGACVGGVEGFEVNGRLKFSRKRPAGARRQATFRVVRHFENREQPRKSLPARAPRLTSVTESDFIANVNRAPMAIYGHRDCERRLFPGKGF